VRGAPGGYATAAVVEMKGTMWHLKLFKRLLNVAIHNTMVMYRSLPNKKSKILYN
jgi:hypothetical protein